MQGFLAPIPGATITVCTAAATGTPCTPVVPTSPVTLCKDSSCAVAAPNPFLSDSQGNFGLWALPGTYKVSITAPGVTGYLLTVVLPAPLSGTNNWTGPNSFSQQITSTVSTGTAPFSIASTTVTPNLSAQLHNGLTAPASAIVGISDSQTLTNKTITTPTINGLSIASPVAQIATQTTAATNFGTTLSTQTVVASVPATGIVTISSQGIVTTVGVGCSASANNVTATFSYTAPGGTVLTWTGVTFTITGNGTIDNGDLGATDSGAIVKVAAKAGTAITYSTTSSLGSTGCSTVPQYTIFAKAFF